MHTPYKALLATLWLFLGAAAYAAAPNRITRPVDSRLTAPVQAKIHSLAQPRYDQGAVEPAFTLDYMLLLVKPSASQQSDLDRLLADQQNPASPLFHKWLTPEEFGDRFGLNPADYSKVVAWLHSEGFTVRESARARNWIAFKGTAGQVRRALHTEIHRFQVKGETHFANIAEPAVPAALADVIGGVAGLHDFNPKPAAKAVQPEFNSGTTHYLSPEDFSTIYDVAPLAAAGMDGTGVNIGIVGQSQLVTSDLDTFRFKYNLPAGTPKSQLVGNDPGLDPNALIEANLDLEWSSAIAPKAAMYYYYSTNFLNGVIGAVNANVVNVISISFGGSELDLSALTYQTIFQQANAQGITVMAASGDQGAANFPDSGDNATHGAAVSFPASFPEVTAVGGTQFNEGTGTYWATRNTTNGGSAMSYIPEVAWGFGGGGASTLFAKPAWQTGPGVPADKARDLPDVSLSASDSHDAYLIVFTGVTLGVGGTSASSPSLAGIVALLNQSLVANGNLAHPGLGNINPQLYRLAQAAPSVFHDITGGTNMVTCEQGSAGCTTGILGYSAGPGYDLATGIGSLDVNNLATQWNNATNAVNVTLTATPTRLTLNDSLQITAVVAPASGSGVPSGTVDFSNSFGIALGSVALDPSSGQPTASLTVPGWQMGTIGTFVVSAQYRGDTAFSPGGATTKVQVTAPTGASAVIPVAPVSVSALPDASGFFWQFNVVLRERGGVAAMVTGLTLDGQAQPVSQYFASPNIPPNGSLASKFIVFRNLAYPLVRTLGFSGTDAAGQNWTRQISVTFLAPQSVETILLSAVPLTMQQDTSATPGCQWSQQVFIIDTGGFDDAIVGLFAGNISLNDQIFPIFGTNRLAAYRWLQGTLCWPAVAPGGSDSLEVDFASGLVQFLTVSFAGPAANPVAVSASPASVTMSSASPQAQSTLSVTAPDGQSWSASILPQNRSTGWLTLSQSSGAGSGQITLQANGTGFENGVYLATIVIQGPNLSPPSVTVPVMFVFGDSSAMTITGLTNAASGQTGAASGMTATLKGTGLAASTFRLNTGASFFQGGVSLTVNGIPAAFKFVSPTQIDFQIPYETSLGAAVVGVNNNGQVGGFLFQVTPSAPGIYAPTTAVTAGKAFTITMTGEGATSSTIPDGVAPTTAQSLVAKPALPFTVTIGGVPVFVNSYGTAANAVGITTVNMTVPAATPTGMQPLVVTVNGVQSPPVMVTVM